MRPTFKSLHLPLLLFPLFLIIGNSAVFSQSTTSNLPSKPNIVFIISDDLTATALSCYGNPVCKTPNIDRLSKQGVQFTRCYTQNPVCGPARAALMSGTYSRTNGVWGNGQSNRFTKNMGNRPTLASHLRKNGYTTARISKIYHMRVPGDITAGVSGPDHKDSWDIAINCQGDEQWTKGQHQHWTKEKLRPDPQKKKHYNLGYGAAFYEVQDPTDGMAQADAKAATKADELLKKFSQDKKPFLLAVGLVRPHVPFVAPKTDFQKYPTDQIALPKSIENDWDDLPKAGISKNSQRIGLRDMASKQSVIKAYYASVTFMDRQVGRILDSIEKHGLTNDTIVVFTSDHGYHLGEHEFWQKLSLHEESARVPLIVRIPGQASGTRDQLCQHIDLFPTFADLAKTSHPKHLQGKSLSPALKSSDARTHDAVFCQLNRNHHLIRTDRWALMKYKGGGVELYDMNRDPHQFNNLANDPKHLATANRLQKQLEKQLAKLPSFAKPKR